MNTIYNHYLTPNSQQLDCATYHNPGWKAARSLHPGGVNTLFGDGRVAFVKNSVSATVWRGIATRAGGEAVSGDAY